MSADNRGVIPADTLLNRWRHRRHVLRQHARDRQTQVQIGMDSFPDDWQRLMAQAPRPVRRRVWMLWFQGEAEAPDMVRTCIASWRRLNPGWQVEVLDGDSLARWIEPPTLPAQARLNHRANVVRLALLARHGGVWADATTLCLRPLDDWIDRTQACGFFAFARPQPARPVANWFIAARPDAPLLAAWRQWSEIYLTSSRPPASYFWQHHTFDWLLRRSPELARAWTAAPQISARGPHILQRLIDGHLPREALPTRAQLAEIPFFKLNRRKGYTRQQIETTLAAWNLEHCYRCAGDP